MYGSKDIPGVGRVELAWVSGVVGVGGKDEDAGMGGVGVGGDADGGKGGMGVGLETEFDVAEEDERWMVE